MAIYLLLINNYYIKKLLQYFYKNVINDEKTDNEFVIIRNKILLLLNEGIQIFFEFDINKCLESYNNICKLYFELDKLIVDEKIENTIYIDKKQIYNLRNNFDFEQINKFPQILYNNNNLELNKRIYNQNISLYNNKKIPFDYLINNPINNNISYNNYNLLNNINSIENEINNQDFIYIISPESNKIKNTKKNSYKIKRNIFNAFVKRSRYRGVTKNKKKWQSYIRINNKNTYLGSYKSETIAATVYDLMSIKKKGNKAKTNFKYTKRQIKIISKLGFDIN